MTQQLNPNVTKYYEKSDFKKLNKQWRDKLKKSGFEDVEQEDGNLKLWHSFRFMILEAKNSKDSLQNRVENNKIKEFYYRVATKFLHTHKFKSAKERRIWELHCEGHGWRKIDKILNNKPGRGSERYRKIVTDLVKLLKEQHINGDTDDDRDY